MYISTREMVISIICNACGVIGLILWAIEAHKSNASQRIQSVESVDRKDEPQVDGAIDEARFYAHCMNCQRDVADIKCLDCDGDKHFIKDEPQTVLEAVLERQTDEDRRKMEESIRKAIKDEQSGKE